MPLVNSKGGAFATVTQLPISPLNFRALPNLPRLQTGPVKVPLKLFPLFPDESAVVVPLPSSKPYAATKPALSAFPLLPRALSSRAPRARQPARTKNAVRHNPSPAPDQPRRLAITNAPRYGDEARVAIGRALRADVGMLGHGPLGREASV